VQRGQAVDADGVLARDGKLEVAVVEDAASEQARRISSIEAPSSR
jgi:hypothetical protein